MEFEKSLFRVHRRTLSVCYDTHRFGGCLGVVRGCMFVAEIACAILAVVMLALVIVGHVTYVGQAGCMPNAVASSLPPGVQTDDPSVLYSFVVTASDTDESVMGRYSFVEMSALAFLPQSVLTSHNFTTVNVTVPLSCPDFSGIAPGVASVLGIDTIIINQCMFTFESSGFIQNADSLEAFSWATPESLGFAWGVVDRFASLVLSLLNFGYTSAVTALLVRTLLAAGVIVFYPILLCLRFTGSLAIPESAILRSYPWLGLHIASLRAQRKSLFPFLGAQLCQLFLLYSMYEASQVTWGVTFYPKSMPEGMRLAIYGWVLVAEYYNMVMLRSAPNIRFFPRLFLCLYLMFHLFFYANSYSFYMLAVGSLACFSLWAMLYLLRTAEVRALRGGMVASDRPRAFLNAMPWASSPADLPPLWTLFFPINVRTVAIQDVPVPPQPNGPFIPPVDAAAAQGDDGAGDGAGASGDAAAGQERHNVPGTPLLAGQRSAGLSASAGATASADGGNGGSAALDNV